MFSDVPNMTLKRGDDEFEVGCCNFYQSEGMSEDPEEDENVWFWINFAERTRGLFTLEAADGYESEMTEEEFEEPSIAESESESDSDDPAPLFATLPV
jgi:hypothetical protein